MNNWKEFDLILTILATYGGLSLFATFLFLLWFASMYKKEQPKRADFLPEKVTRKNAK